jgi:chromate transporter
VTPTPDRPTALRELALVFLKLGATSFGGPAAHVAMMEEEVVARRRWLTREEFLDLFGMTNLIPGPNSTELAIHIGRVRAGVPGLIVAGASFIVPAMLIVLALAWAYVRYGALPASLAVIAGIQPVVIAIVLQALVRFSRTALSTPTLVCIALAAAAANALGADELLVLLAAALGALVLRSRSSGAAGASALALLPQLAPAALAPCTATALFLFFLKVGSVLFGSGYVLIAFLRADLVTRWGWLTEAQLLDAVAAGQITPGPVFTTATFIGYVLGGPGWALLATLGIFLPAFVFVAASAPLVPLLRRSESASALLRGINAASVALMAVVTWRLAEGALVDAPTVALALASAALLLATRVSSIWLVVLGGAVGLVRFALA